MKSRLELLTIAVVLACVDVAHKLATPTQYHHGRSLFAGVAIAGVLAGLVVFVPRLPSRAALVGAGIAAGGALGNLASIVAWRGGVPDPFVLSRPGTGVA